MAQLQIDLKVVAFSPSVPGVDEPAGFRESVESQG